VKNPTPTLPITWWGGGNTVLGGGHGAKKKRGKIKCSSQKEKKKKIVGGRLGNGGKLVLNELQHGRRLEWVKGDWGGFKWGWRR